MESEHEKSTTFFRFEDLRIYHKAIEYADWVHHHAADFSKNVTTNELVTKFVHAAQSIAMNIAEGSSRNKSQFVYYLKMAKSSVRECVVYTTICSKQKLFKDAVVEESRNHLMEMTKMIGALIGSLQRSTKGIDDDAEDHDADI